MAEVEGCDALTRVQVRSFKNFMLQFGLLLHPVAGLHIGAHVKSAVNLGLYPIEATGTVSAIRSISRSTRSRPATRTGRH